MITLIYYMPNDIHVYVYSCVEEYVDLFVKTLIENGAYKIIGDNGVKYYEQ